MKNPILNLIVLSVMLSCLSYANFVFARAGDLDTDFGTGGRATLDLGGSNQNFVDVIEDGSYYYALGKYNDPSDLYHSRFLIARFDQNGNLDTSFASSGYSVHYVSGVSVKAVRLRKLDNGYLVVSGSIYNSKTGNDFYFATFDSNGTFVAEYQKSLLSTTYYNEVFSCILPTSSSSEFLLVGMIDQDVILAKGNSSGSLVTSFGADNDSDSFTDGYYLINDFGLSVENCAYDDTGKILLTGGLNDFILARITLDGNLDSSSNFGDSGTGMSTLDLGSAEQYSERANSVFTDSDGNIWLGGSKDSIYAIAKFGSTGEPDLTFNSDAYVINDLGLDIELSPVVTQLDQNNNIITIGSHMDETSSEIYVTRNLISGALDTNDFGTDGYTKISFKENGKDASNSGLVDSQNKIVISGYSDTEFALYRLMNDPGSSSTDTTTTDDSGSSTTTTTSTPTGSTTNTSGNTADQNGSSDQGDQIVDQNNGDQMPVTDTNNSSVFGGFFAKGGVDCSLSHLGPQSHENQSWTMIFLFAGIIAGIWIVREHSYKKSAQKK